MKFVQTIQLFVSFPITLNISVWKNLNGMAEGGGCINIWGLSSLYKNRKRLGTTSNTITSHHPLPLTPSSFPICSFFSPYFKDNFQDYKTALYRSWVHQNFLLLFFQEQDSEIDRSALAEEANKSEKMLLDNHRAFRNAVLAAKLSINQVLDQFLHVAA